MDDFTSAYLKRISELEEERKSTVFSAPIPLPTYSSSVRLPQRKGEPNTKNEKAPSVSSFKNDLVSKTSEKRVPDLENRLKIAADNANYQADKLEHERSMSMAPVWNAQSLTGSYIPTAEQEQEVEDARAKGAELQSRIDALRRQANEYRAASQAEGYKSVINSSDFSTYSSRPESQRDTAIKKMSNGKADERYLVGLEHADGVGSMEWIQRTEQLTDQELGIYNYLRNKEGQESADKFLDYMEETLNQRLGGKQAENISNIENPVGKFLATGGYGFISGVDQFGSGVRQLFSEKALPTSAIQFGAAQVREDLADAGPKLGSRSLGQAAFEGTQMIGNMLPSIAIGSMAGGAGISANVAKALGSGVMSASAGGNAYNEAVKQGYTPEQARSYGTLVALSEGGLQYLLGGISALGGKVSGKIISKTIQNISNAFLRAGVGLGLSAFSEGVEEYAQEVINPMLRNIALDENNPVELVSEDAIYSGIMGALSAGLFEGPSRVTDAVSDVRTNQELRSIDRSYADMQENGIFGQGPRLLPTAGSVGREGTTTAGAWYDRNVGSAVDTQAPKNASTIETVTHRMTMEDFTNVNSPVWNNVEYGDTETQSRITRQTHQAMVEEGAVVTVPDSTREQVGQSYPDLRGMKKAERTPILRQKMKELKASLRQFLNGLKGGSYEFNVNGNILEAKLYDTGVREVLEKIDQSKASMLYHSDQVFQNARYLYSTPDYDGDPNVYRWNYFYTPVQIGDEIVGVRIAVRDMVRQTDGSMDSQIYNWGIKTGAALDGGERGNMPDRSDVSSATPDGAALDGGGRGQTRISSDVSSAAPDGITLGTSASSVNPSRSSIPQSGGENNINTEQGGPRTLPAAEEIHIADRTWQDASSRKVNAFQYDHPELRPYYQSAARALLSDLSSAVKGERFPTFDQDGYVTGYTGVKRSVSEPIEQALDNANLSYAQIRKAAEDLIADHGQENYAAAKKLELILDQMLSDGYTDAEGRFVEPDPEYIAVRDGQPVSGSEYRMSEEEWNSIMGNEPMELPTIPKVGPESSVGAASFGFDPYTNLVNQYGAIKPGENPARVVDAPRKTGEREKVSLTARTVMEAAATPDAFVPEIAQSLVDGKFSYIPVSNEARAEKAARKIERTGYSDALKSWTSSVRGGKASADLVAMGAQLYNAAVNAGDTKQAMEILYDYTSLIRQSAQATQAARILKTLTPEGRLYLLQKEVNSLNDSLSDRQLKKLYKAGEENGISIDETMADAYLNAKTAEEQQAAYDALVKDVAGKIPSTFADKWNAWRYMSMLVNPRTHIRNMSGNLFWQPVRIAKDRVAAAIEAGVSAATGGKLERTKSFFYAPALYNAAWADWANVKDTLGGGKYNDLSGQINDQKTIFKNKALETVRKTNSDLLELEDSVFKRITYADALAGFLHANGVTAEQLSAGQVDGALLERARAYAGQEALKATYQDRNAFSNLLASRFSGKNGVERAANMAVDAVLPFRRTPANILVRGVEYSPIGLAKSLFYDLGKVKAGKMSGAEAIDNIAAGLTGSALMALGALLAGAGLVSGAEDDDKQKAMDDLTGRQEYALNLPGGGSVTLDWLAPESLPFFMGVELAESLGENGVTADGITDALSSVSEPMLEMSMLQSLNDLIDSVSYVDSSGKIGAMAGSDLISYFNQAVPTFFGQVERTLEDTRMTTYTDKNLPIPTDIQYALGKASAKIPGWDYQQIPYTDAWGREEENGPLPLRAFNNFLNPAYTSRENVTQLDAEMQRLYDATGDGVVIPKRAEKSIKVDDETITLSAEQYDMYNRTRGQTANQILEALIRSTLAQAI